MPKLRRKLGTSVVEEKLLLARLERVGVQAGSCPSLSVGRERKAVSEEADGPATEAEDGEVEALLLLAASLTDRTARAVEPLTAFLPLLFRVGLVELAREEAGSLLTCGGLGLGVGGIAGEEEPLCGMARAMFLHEMGKASTWSRLKAPEAIAPATGSSAAAP